MFRTVMFGLLVGAVAGCYEPQFRRCQHLCGAEGACPSGTACGSDGYCHAPDDPASCLGSPDGSAPDAVTPSADGAPPDAMLPGAPCDPMEVIDTTSGVFVSGAGGSPGGAGDPISPLDTIGAALVLARATGRWHIYLDEGTYAEAVEILDSPNGVTIDGAWIYSGLTWQRDCAPDRVMRTLIRPNGPIGVTATDVIHMSGLSNLSVATSARMPAVPDDTPGGSRIAVFVRGTGSAFRLHNVLLVPGDGDPGGAATAGASGSGAASCDGTTDCSMGMMGMPGAPGADAMIPGIFDVNGFTPSDGERGPEAGFVGQNGTAGDPTESRSNCNTGCYCTFCFTSFDSTIVSQGGTCGCGGNGGGTGAAGRGGGASVALLVVGNNAVVSVEYSVLRAGNGGDGSAGGLGGPGAGGTTGMAGDPAQYCRHMDCIGGCGMPADCGYNPADTTDLIPAKAAGGAGGQGGTGSVGGGGAGGPSYAVAIVGGGNVVDDGMSVFVPGAGGNGGDDALNGDSAAERTFP